MGPHEGMKTFRHDVLVLSAALLLYGILYTMFPPVASASDPFVGNIESIESDSPAHKATIVRTGRTGGVPAKQGDAVFKGDTIRTDDGVKARIELSDGSMIGFGPNSAIQMKDYVLISNKRRRNYTIKALQGTIRFMITKLFRNKATGAEASWKDSNLTIETTTAVCGVRGTDFTVIIGETEVQLAVFDGLVSVKNVSSSIRGAILLSANQISRINRGFPPSPPSLLPPQLRDKLMKLTTPASSVHSSQKGPGSAKIDKKSMMQRIARDVAAGMRLKDIMKRALREGIDLSTIIAGAIQAGIDPGTVVYTAIMEGHAAEAVIQAALTAGAPMNAVVNAASGAGVDAATITAAAATAGAPPAAVADAIATAVTPGSPVYGYGSPGAAPDVYTPPAPVVSGGGGGATPSTQTASPAAP